MHRSILATLAYYDVLDFPLSRIELFKFCIPASRLNPVGSFSNHSNLSTVAQTTSNGAGPSFSQNRFDFKKLGEALDDLKTAGEIEDKNGFFTLKGRSLLFQKRIEKKKISDQKWKKALKALKWFQTVPYIRAVFASGSLAMENTGKESDLDVLVAAKTGRIWTARFLLSLAMSLLGVRRKRYDKIASDKICLNHYITTESLHIPFHSLYNAQTYAHLIPVWISDEEIIKSFERENEWVREYVNFWKISEERKFRTVNSVRLFKWPAFAAEKILDSKLGNFLEWLLGKIQYQRISKDPSFAKPGGRVTVDNRQLEFHPDSPEKKIIEKYNQTLKNYRISSVFEKDSGLLF